MAVSKKSFKDKNARLSKSQNVNNYSFCLFVSGMLPNSVRAIKNINSICEQYLKGNFELSVIDIYQQPDLAIAEQVIAIPVLIIKYPLPERRLIGDLSDTDKILDILNLK